MVWEVQPKRDLTRGVATLADFLDWRDRNHVFEDMAAWLPLSYNLTRQSEPEEGGGARVTADFFNLFKVKPPLRRTFLPGEEQTRHHEGPMLGYWICHAPF